jgi:tetratricopeptide (TPR) repeat protein
MKPIIILLSCLISLNAFGQQDLSTALKLANSEQYEEAEKVFQDLLTKDASNGDIYYYFGETYLRDYLSDTFSNSLDEFAQKAEQLFQSGIKAAPGNVLNQVGMGAVTLMRTSDTTKAIPYFTQAETAVPLKMKKKDYTPQQAVILTKLAVAQLFGKVHRYKAAIDYLNRAKVINPLDPNIYLALGEVYIRMNDASNALFNYNQALNKDPKSPLPKIRIGNIYMRVPNLNAARPYFEEAKEIDSTFAPVYRSLGELYTLAGRYDLAKENYRKFVQMSGNTTPAKVRYGNSLFRAKDYEGALAVIKEVLQVDHSRNYLNRLAAYSSYDKKPQDLEGAKAFSEEFFKNASEESIIPRDYAYYGRTLYRLAKNDTAMQNKAFKQLKKAYELDPSDGSVLSELAMDYYYARRYEDAIAMYKLKAEKGLAAPSDAMQIGKAYYSMNEIEKADSAFKAIVSTNPDNMQAHLYLARTASKVDSTSELGLAQPEFLRVIELTKSDSVKYKAELFEAFSYMGYYLMQTKKYDESKLWYTRLINLDPKNKEWQIKGLSSLALIAYKEKNYVEARNLTQKMLVLDPGNPKFKEAIVNLDKVIKGAAKN